jgi:hypothetical protein
MLKEFQEGLKTIQEQVCLIWNNAECWKGGKVLVGGKVLEVEGNFVEPTLVATDHTAPIVKQELFVPIVHVLKCKVGQQSELNNSSPELGRCDCNKQRGAPGPEFQSIYF